MKSSISSDTTWRAWWHQTFETAESWVVIFLVGNIYSPPFFIKCLISSYVRRGNRIDVSLDHYCYRLVVRYKNWLLFNCLVAQSKVLLLANGRIRFEKGRKEYLIACCSKRNLDGGCADWTDWSEFVNLGPDVYIVKWLFYILWAVSVNLERNNEELTYILNKDNLCHAMRLSCQNFGPLCCRFGHIGNQMYYRYLKKEKSIRWTYKPFLETIAGFVMKGFLGGWTLVMKSIGLVTKYYSIY